MTYSNIMFETTDGISTITFNRPKALNALNSDLLGELDRALQEINGNEEIRVLVLTGTGEKAFVAGADITELAKLDTLSAKVFINKGLSIINKIAELPIPAIAAVNGFFDPDGTVRHRCGQRFCPGWRFGNRHGL